MKKLFPILMVGVTLSCSRLEPASEEFPHYQIKDEDWIVYEGTLPTASGAAVHVELSLFPGAPGLDSRYRMIESYPDTLWPAGYNGWVGSHGRYMVLSSPGAQLIHIADRSLLKALSKAGKFPTPEFSKEDLYLKSDGEHKLIF